MVIRQVGPPSPRILARLRLAKGVGSDIHPGRGCIDLRITEKLEEHGFTVYNPNTDNAETYKEKANDRWLRTFNENFWKLRHLAFTVYNPNTDSAETYKGKTVDRWLCTFNENFLHHFDSFARRWIPTSRRFL